MGKRIAIDGPSGSGKSTIAKALAKRLGFVHIDTGAMYRAVALRAQNIGVNIGSEAAVLGVMENISLDIQFNEGRQIIFLDGEDVTTLLRSLEIGIVASRVSAFAGVRERLVLMQQNLAKERDVVMDGRDVGTVVLSDADLKIFLEADVKVRAERRCAEMLALGHSFDYDEVLSQIIKRDLDDTSREHSPLVKAKDAVVIDASYLDIDEAVEVIYKIICEKRII